MKKEKNFRILNSIGDVDERYILEASPFEEKKKKRSPRRLMLTAACIATLVMTLSLWLFIPFSVEKQEDVSRYRDSEYYEIIEKLNSFKHSQYLYSAKHSPSNNFEKILSNFGATKEDAAAPADGEFTLTTGTVDGGKYVEATDNQERGVIEGDLIKRGETHIYYMREEGLSIYTIEGEESKLVSSFEISYSDNSFSAFSAPSFYLSNDCTVVTVVDTRHSRTGGEYVAIISLDVSDPQNVTEKKRVTLSGSEISSRMVGGKLLLMSGFSVFYRDIDFTDESTFIPQINVGNGNISLPIDNIVCPDELDSSRYTVVTVLEEKTLELKDSAAYLCYSDDVYVSDDTVYLMRRDYDTKENVTEISPLDYSGEKLLRGESAIVSGYVNDQYSLSEYKDILRVVTTTNTNGVTSASLYCLDAVTMKEIASVKNFAPKGENVRSVRFDGDIAYVCTAIEVKDPVFFFDLSDLSQIRYTDTGTIDGFSTSLVNFGDGYLLGVGVGATGHLKIEVYTEGANKVESVCKYEENGYASGVYKSYYINREEGLVGLGVTSAKDHYILLHFGGSSIIKVEDIPLSASDDMSAVRAQLIDGYLYVFSTSGFAVEKLG